MSSNHVAPIISKYIDTLVFILWTNPDTLSREKKKSIRDLNFCLYIFIRFSPLSKRIHITVYNERKQNGIIGMGSSWNEIVRGGLS